MVIKYYVERSFKDKYSKKNITAKSIIDVTVERMKELNSKSIGRVIDIIENENITKEVFGKQSVEIQKAGVYSDNVVIKVKEISEEQKNTLNTKINEKYSVENKVEDIEVNYIPSYRLRDIIKPYIVPFISVTVVIFAYLAIRFRKLGIAKVLSQVAVLTTIAELLYISIIAITRYPINRVVLPIGIVIYMIIITVLNGMFEKELTLKSK